MRCSKCNRDNRAGRKFCANCGSALTLTCPKCGGSNQPDEKFCGECGAELAEAAVPKGPEVTSIAVSGGGERRHLTVLFCDLVGSTEIASRLDPEEWRELVAGYHSAAAEAITRYGGHVAKYLGDGVMAYFGWPEAHENDAERAVRAGLAVLEEVSKLNPNEPTHSKVSVRVGIDSGPVVVGAGAGKVTDIFGEAPNIAARVQNAAAPDTVVVTASTHRLISGLFVLEERGAQELKGIANPIELYRVLRPTGVRGRLAAARGLTPFIGREEELRLLLSRWERAREGEGQLVLVVGEAGIGKSRLVAEFHDRIRATPHSWMESAGEQFFENTPFHAIIEMLSQWLEPQGGANPDDRFERLEMALSSAGLKPEDVAPLVAELLQLPVAERYPLLTLAPEAKRQRLLAALASWVFGAARLQPVVTVVEDLHWLDPSTLELQQLLVEQGATVPLMLLYSARPEFRTPWPLRAHHTQITLNRLSTRSVREMVALVAARKALADETVDAVIERTSGVPLFVEELTRVVLESGSTKLQAREIPATLHDSLMARLDRLGPAREVVQIGAVIGTEFSYDLLHAVHPISERDLQAALRSATDAELVYARGIAPDASYQIKHALIRDAAYDALLKSRRKELHRLVAQTIDEQFPALKDSHPELLARHWTEAGETERAIFEWSRAAETSYAHGAFREAMESCQQAFAMMKLLPESPRLIARELELMRTVFSMLWVTKGFSAQETNAAAERAATLAEKSGDLSQYCNWIRSQCLAANVAGHLSAAASLGDQALELALREGSPNSIGRAHMLQLNTSFWRGDLARVEKHFAAALEFFDRSGFTHYPGSAAFTFSNASWCAWMMGRPELARERIARMQAAVKGKSAFDVTLSWIDAAQLQIYMREYQQAEALAARGLELAQQHQFPFLAAFARCILGRARAQVGLADEGVALIRQGLANLFEARMYARISNYTGYLAEAQERQGAITEALETVEQALQANPDELSYRPEIFRARGELRLRLDEPELAEKDFREAIAIALSMGAKAWELRATMSCARLLAKQGRRQDARLMLAEIYNWFTEGFDTADLKEAKALLDELSA